MGFPRSIRNYNVFIDGVSFFGKCTEATMPPLQMATASHRGAGMDAPIDIDMGLQSMTATASFREWSPDLCHLFGTVKPIVFRPAALGEDTQTADTHIYTVRGLWTGWEPGMLKGGDPSDLKLTCSVRYFRAELNGVEVFEIDPENGKRVIGGVDQTAELRKAMGII